LGYRAFAAEGLGDNLALLEALKQLMGSTMSGWYG